MEEKGKLLLDDVLNIADQMVGAHVESFGRRAG